MRVKIAGAEGQGVIDNDRLIGVIKIGKPEPDAPQPEQECQGEDGGCQDCRGKNGRQQCL